MDFINKLKSVPAEVKKAIFFIVTENDSKTNLIASTDIPICRFA